MAYKGPHGITILEGRDPVRRRPTMYIGGEVLHPSARVRLLEYAVGEIAHERPQEVRILLWREDAVTIAYDGSPLIIEPFGPPIDGVSHPALYRSLCTCSLGRQPSRAVLNPLPERLVAPTMQAGHRHRVVFSKGTIVSLLRRSRCDRPLGVTWLTYRADATIIAGEVLTSGEVQGLAERGGERECARKSNANQRPRSSDPQHESAHLPRSA
jgi:hypothetical protein